MQTLRTPDDRFTDMPEFPYTPMYCEVSDGDGGTLRMAWVQDGPKDADPVLMLHGEPSWSFLYRKMIPVLAAAGHRVVCPDLVGFGRSDKPTRREDHTYARHVEWMRTLAFDVLDLRRATLVGQDWGGLIGLRMAAEHPERFSRLVVANTGCPPASTAAGDLVAVPRGYPGQPSLEHRLFVQCGCREQMSDGVRAGYDAPFPDDDILRRAARHARSGADLAGRSRCGGQQAAWATAAQVRRQYWSPSATAIHHRGDGADLSTRDAGGARHRAPVAHDAGHFLQEDAGEELRRPYRRLPV